jgi:cytochrome c oxidase assembly protein subunit 15
MLPGAFAGALRVAYRPALALVTRRGAHSASTAVLSAAPKRLLFAAQPAASCSAIISRIRTNAFHSTHARPASSSIPESSGPPAEQPALPTLSGPPVAGWLLLCSTLVFAIVVVGGVTRLTESGLSITEWKPVTGIIPPLSHGEWEAEFDKYKATPEFKM